MTDQTTLAQRVSSSYSNLVRAATDLNAVSDELGKAVAQIDFALKNLNLGITVWVQIGRWDPGESEDFNYWSEEIGYAKVNGKWGISLKRTDGNHNNPQRDDTELWLFNDGPRSLRLEAIEKIPILLEKLSIQAASATNMVKEKLADVRAVAAVVAPPSVAHKITGKASLGVVVEKELKLTADKLAAAVQASSSPLHEKVMRAVGPVDFSSYEDAVRALGSVKK